MRIIYPYAEHYPEAIAALPLDAEQVDVSADPEAYWRLLRDLWRSGEDFLIVEHDMVLPDGALHTFDSCRREWCAHPYFMYGTWGTWHGVTRYRGGLTRRLPNLPDEIRSRTWPSLDSAWINHLRLAGVNEAHWHWPPARHLNPAHPPMAVPCPHCGADIALTVGRSVAELTADDALAPFRASLRLTMTAGIL